VMKETIKPTGVGMQGPVVPSQAQRG